MDTTAYNYTLGGLEEETIALIFDVLEECFYKNRKKPLTNHQPVSETAKFNHLLTNCCVNEAVDKVASKLL